MSNSCATTSIPDSAQKNPAGHWLAAKHQGPVGQGTGTDGLSTLIRWSTQ